MRSRPAGTKELTEAANSVAGHKFFLWRVCDWSDSVRNSLAFLRALEGFDEGVAEVNS